MTGLFPSIRIFQTFTPSLQPSHFQLFKLSSRHIGAIMGIVGLFLQIRKKQYRPQILHNVKHHSTSNGAKVRVDLLGAFYSTVRWAYITHPVDKAQEHVHHKLEKTFDKANAIIYVDGVPPVEKQDEHRKRKERRRASLTKAGKYAEVLMERVNKQLRVRKHHFQSVRKNLYRAFHLDLSDTIALACYLRSMGWEVIECETEADVQIARDCMLGDFVVSGDSDLLIYNSVQKVWRPISGGRFLEYVVDDILDTFGLSRHQWIALGIVSRNDYNSNIYGLGWVSNFGIIKKISTSGKRFVIIQNIVH